MNLKIQAEEHDDHRFINMIPSSSIIDSYQIVIDRSYQYKDLEVIWLELQELVKPSFFLTWSWMSCWLKTYHPEVIVVKAVFKESIVAIGLFTMSIEHRRGVIHSRQLRLHQMGEPLLDQICIEYNGFLCHPEHQATAPRACIQYLMTANNDWDEIIISKMHAQDAHTLGHHLLRAKTDFNTPCYTSDLNNLQSDTYIDSLSKNSRYQIRRSIRLFEKSFGQCRLEVATEEDQMLGWFYQAGLLHQERWGDSGFKNDSFVKFHQNLISQNHQNGKVNFIKISFGNLTIAYLYFFSINKIAYFYLQGVLSFENGKLKPGLVAHALAIQYFIDKGYEKYDFMGGHSQYKVQLSNETSQLETLIIQNQRILLTLEDRARKIKQWIKN